MAIKTSLLVKVKKLLAKRVIITTLVIFSFLLTVFLIYNLIFLGRIFPGISIAGTKVSGLTYDEAFKLLSEKVEGQDKTVLIYDNSSFEIKLNTVGFSYDLPKTIGKAYELDRSGVILLDFYNRIKAPFRTSDLSLSIEVDEDLLLEHLSIISEEISQEPVYPTAKLIDGFIVVEKGTKGTEVDLEKLRIAIIDNLSYLTKNSLVIPLKTIDPTINDAAADALKMRAENILGKTLLLSTDEQRFEYKEDDLFKLLEPSSGYRNQDLLALIKDVSSLVNRSPENAIFVFESGKVIEFSPAKDGLEVNAEALSAEIISTLSTLEHENQDTATTKIPLSVTAPEITLDAINNLGIRELLGRGHSRFRGSISSRIHNISVASSRFNGVLISPEETFSFNEVLGDVSAYTGYKQAYIIKDGRTVLGDGGGVCQVSTTLFRAALDSGLPIVNRRAHSYRVTYYEQDSLPGLDATVYAPYTDLKFKNDTPGHLLIQTQFDSSTATLAFEVYGTSDGRVSTITKPVITSSSAPPEDLYVDDPTLPVGTIEQIDYKAWGANVYFDYQVKRGGEVLYEKTFYSNFRPWQAVYLRGTGPVN